MTDKFFVEAVLPWRKVVNNKFTYDSRQFIRKSYGYGDAILIGKYQFDLFNEEMHGTIGVGLKLANGMLDEPDETGNRISDNLQIGSGVVDPVYTLYLSHSSPDRKWLFSGSFITRQTSDQNIYGYRYGDEYHSSIGINFDKSDILFFESSIEFIYTKRDVDQYGFRLKRERGGKWVYFTPGLGIRLRNNLNLDIQYPISVYQYVNESQLISSGFLRVNLSYTIGG